MEINYLNGKRHGSFIWLYESGNKRHESTYSNGNWEGLHTSYYDIFHDILLFLGHAS